MLLHSAAFPDIKIVFYIHPILFLRRFEDKTAFYNDTQDYTFLTLVLLKGNRLTNYLLSTLSYAHVLLACTLLKTHALYISTWYVDQ